jgi:hypothetical protein
MDTVQAFFLGLLIAWVPCLAILAWLLWRAPLISSMEAPARRMRARTRQRNAKRSGQQYA